MSGRRTANAALARPRIARLRSTILRVRRGGADRDALWFMPPLETEGRCGGVCDFRYARDTRNPGIKNWRTPAVRALKAGTGWLSPVVGVLCSSGSAQRIGLMMW